MPMPPRSCWRCGLSERFEVTLNCPNDRYVNDARICQTVAANLSRIGVKINLRPKPRVPYFPRSAPRHQLYMLGWTPGTYDAHNALNALMACVDDKGAASSTWAATATPRWTS